jgi:hypothetical protein
MKSTPVSRTVSRFGLVPEPQGGLGDGEISGDADGGGEPLSVGARVGLGDGEGSAEADGDGEAPSVGATVGLGDGEALSVGATVGLGDGEPLSVGAEAGMGSGARTRDIGNAMAAAKSVDSML